jgi:UDP-N-acetyl-D-mannosaminuronic acid dehydrogenase
MTLLEAIRERTATIVIIGMGRVGLPLGIAFAAAGFRVMGVDGDAERRSAIELGKMPFLEPGTDEALMEVVTSGRLTVHGEVAQAAPKGDVLILAVGTPLAADLRADYAQLRNALADLAPSLRTGQLVILRSTVSPGTLLKVIQPALRELAPGVASHLLLAACPERIAEGHAMKELTTLPEIVGGVDETSAQATAELFCSLGSNKRIHFTDPTSAELAKLFTNVYRYVNFALANEFGILGEHYGVDTHRILDMVNDDYPRANIPMPGPAGGPCLSKDGYFLVEELTMPDFVLLAWKLNDSMPAHLMRRLATELSRDGFGLAGTPIAVLGRTFKRDSDDTRQSPASRMIELLGREGAIVRAHDPYLSGPSFEEALTGAKGFVLATNHSAYDGLQPREVAELMDAPRVGVDCWGVLDRPAFAKAGVRVTTFGVGPL